MLRSTMNIMINYVMKIKKFVEDNLDNRLVFKIHIYMF